LFSWLRVASMEVEVCNGSWQHGSILSIRIGSTRRQVPLQMNKRMAFAKGVDEAAHMQVDVFTRVSSSQIIIEPRQQVYQIATDQEGFSGVTLRLSELGASQARSGAPQQRDSNRVYGKNSPGIGEDASAEEKLERVRRNAEEYIEHFGLRQALQDMFQSVIKELPEDPFDFMQALLGENAAKFFDQTYKMQSTESKVVEKIVEVPRVIERVVEKIVEVPVATPQAVADAEEETRRAEQVQRYEERIAEQCREIQVMKDSLESTLQEVAALRQKQELIASPDMGQERLALLEEQEKTASLQTQVFSLEALVRDTRLAADTLREENKDLLEEAESLRIQRTSDMGKAEMLAESERNKNKLIEENKKLFDRLDAVQQENADLNRRLQASQANVVPDVPLNGRATPGDEAAGSGIDLSKRVEKSQVEAVKTIAPSNGVSAAPQLQSSNVLNASRGLSMGQTNRSEGDSYGSSTMPLHWGQATGSTLSTTAGTEVNTHMLSQLLASTYAPPVPPATYFEAREDNEEDIRVLETNAQSNPELVVDIVDCADKLTNGTYAWVGTCNNRPLYRLLGPEPRYLYYAEVDPAWAGWWVADKMGAEEYNEWFREPADAKLPVFCRKGELSSRVIETKITREVAKKIAKVGNQAEKATIRSKLTEAFGAAFTKLDGSQRGLMSKTSPVVGIAHALEAQQRAIQLLHSQVSTEIQRREAAEAHAQTMEEAFETLQLRIQAQLPGSAPAVSPRG